MRVFLVVPVFSPVSAQTESQLTVAFDASIAAAFLDPAQTSSLDRRSYYSIRRTTRS